ncbi:MAG: hypothetical protein AB7O62_24935, partial [Pirellulales bacterium]
TLELLVDRSRSMTVGDAFGDKPRWQAAQQAVTDGLPALRELSENIEIKFYLFDADARELEFTGQSLDFGGEPTGEQSAIGAVLEDVLRRESGKRLAGLILLSDGAQRATEARDLPPQTPARTLRDLGYPLYAVTFGESGGLGQVRDVALKDLVADPAVFVKNQLAVSVTAAFDGFSGQEVPVQLLWETSPGKMEPVSVVLRRPTRDSEQASVELDYIPEVPGEHRLTVMVEPLRGETVTTNNQLSTYVTVLKGGLKVLYLDGRMLPEQKFLRRALAEAQDMHVDFIRIDATRPETRPDNLLAHFQPGQYDVYLIGDVDSKAFQEKELEALSSTVIAGAGLMMLGGMQSFGPGGYDSTPLAKILPIEMDRFERQPLGEKIRTDLHWPGPLTLRPTAQGLEYILRLGKIEESRQLWSELPPLDGMNRLRKKKTSGILLADAGAGKPLLVADNAGNGRVLAFAADSTWHWAMGGGRADIHRRFWRQAVLWLARKDQAEDSQVWVRLNQRRFAPGTRVEFSAGAKDAQGEPLADAQLSAELVLPGGSKKPIRLSREEGQMAGILTGTQQPGEYAIELSATRDGQPLGSTRSRFQIFEQDLELDNPAADPTAMSALAAMTGGEAMKPEQLPALLDRLKSYPEQLEVREQQRSELYDNPWVLTLLISIWSLEWFLRKKWGLV